MATVGDEPPRRVVELEEEENLIYTEGGREGRGGEGRRGGEGGEGGEEGREEGGLGVC